MRFRARSDFCALAAASSPREPGSLAVSAFFVTSLQTAYASFVLAQISARLPQPARRASRARWPFLHSLSLRSKPLMQVSCSPRFPRACRSQLATRAGLAGRFYILCRCAPNRPRSCLAFMLTVQAARPGSRVRRANHVNKKTHRPKPVRLSLDCDNVKLEFQLHGHLQLP
jgi:hypothetical protein